MSDVEAASSRINEHLAEQNEKLEKELADMRALLARPVTIQAPEENTLKKVGEYLPKFGELATNTATIAGQMMQDRQQRAMEHGALLEALKKQDHTQRRIAAALERAYPIPEEGP